MGGWVLGLLWGGPGSDDRITQRSPRIQILWMALVCVLFLGRAATASSPADRPVTPPGSVPDRVATPARGVSNPLVGLVRLGSRCTLRSGKCRHVLFVAVGWDDPNDDETSDDPNDDDDDWQNVNVLDETEAPITAWLPETGCYLNDPESRSEPRWSEPLLLTSFLKLQRLRC